MRRNGTSAHQSGSATVGMLIAGSVLAIIAAAIALVVVGQVFVTRRLEREIERESALLREIEWVIEQLMSDPTPEADSSSDPVWAALGARAGEISLYDVSSAVNPNWIRPTFLDRSGLGEILFVPGSSGAELSQYRVDEGISVRVEEWYADFFENETIEEYLTGHGLFNINVTHEAVLRDVYALRTGSESKAEIFLGRVQDALRDRALWDDPSLRQLFGVDFDLVYPVINVAPAFNAHFLHADVLEAVVTFPYGGEAIPAAETAAQVLLIERQSGEIDPERLQTIFTVETDEQQRLFEYLGTNTWFWRVDVELSQGTTPVAGSVIIMREPVPTPAIGETTDPPIFRVVEWTITA
ncbi:MAG: hypothetical protein MI724_09260 [Spirochaetales bacterium]|nr:hypothetical protein [Spirochaetales bacterium]